MSYFNAQPIDRERSVQDRLNHLEDLEEIRALRLTYHHMINDRHFSRIGEIFTESAVWTASHAGEALEIRWEGRDAIVRGFEKFESYALLKNYPSGHLVKVRGDSAEGVAYFQAKIISAGPEGDLRTRQGGGRYDDRYARVGGRWMFSRLHTQRYY